MELMEKVIKGLEYELQNRGKCGHYCRDGIEIVSCEYDKNGLCIQHWGNDALALLKAQEPVEPTLDVRHGKSMWRCGSCATALQPNQMHAKFCFNCGRAVKWE